MPTSDEMRQEQVLQSIGSSLSRIALAVEAIDKKLAVINDNMLDTAGPKTLLRPPGNPGGFS